MAMPKQYVKSHAGEISECICGNDPDYYGFVPCDRQGNQIEPVAGEWDGLCVCQLCSRIIDDSFAVVGISAWPAKASRINNSYYCPLGTMV